MKVVILGSHQAAFAAAVDQARAATDAILDLESSELFLGESVTDRIRKIARHALTLAKAYAVIDAIAAGHSEAPIDDPSAN
jgi:hypothetical protein